MNHRVIFGILKCSLTPVRIKMSLFSWKTFREFAIASSNFEGNGLEIAHNIWSRLRRLLFLGQQVGQHPQKPHKNTLHFLMLAPRPLAKWRRPHSENALALENSTCSKNKHQFLRTAICEIIALNAALWVRYVGRLPVSCGELVRVARNGLIWDVLLSTTNHILLVRIVSQWVSPSSQCCTRSQVPECDRLVFGAWRIFQG